MTTRPDQQTSTIIRPARQEDVRTIATLILLGSATLKASRQEAEAEASHPSYLAAFAAIAASPDTHLFVAERAGKVIGTCQVTFLPGIAERGRLRSKFESVHVDPDWRGHGIGATMIEFALTFARERGAGIAELSSNKSRQGAHRFYRRLGFEQSHEGFKKLL